MLPIAHGGRYTLANVVPACARCNASKGESELTTWMRRKRLDEPGFLARHGEVQIALGAAGPAEAVCSAPPLATDAGVEEGPQR